MRPSGAWLSGWSRKGVRAQQLDAFRHRVALKQSVRPELESASTNEALLQRVLGIMNARFSMQLSPAQQQPTSRGPFRAGFRTPKQLYYRGSNETGELGVRCRGWWHLPLDGSTRSTVRTFAHFWAHTRLEPWHISGLRTNVLDPETKTPRAMAVVLSVRGFRPSCVDAVMSSSVPFLLVHIPDPLSPESCHEAARVGYVGRSIKESSALDLDFAIGSCWCNRTLRQVLSDRIKITWTRDESVGPGLAVGVPQLVWDDKVLPPVDSSGPNLAERLAARQTAESTSDSESD